VALDDQAMIGPGRRVGAAALVVGVSIGMGAGCTSPARTSNPERVTSSAVLRPPTTVTTPPAAAPSPVPRFAHIVVVVLENHSYNQLIDNPQAPFINRLGQEGVVLTQSFAVTHPSQPNYLALFSGSTHNITDDSCPHTFTGPNLASELLAAGDTFTGYSESLPQPGYAGCSSGNYARKHNPWVDFSNLPASINQPFTAFPTDYNHLSSVSFVIPNLAHDMHDGTIAQSDQWLSTNLGRLAAWSFAHDSLLIVTSDEDDSAGSNRIMTVLSGAHLESGTDSQHVDHYALLTTLEDAFGLPHAGTSATSRPLQASWQR
jgi:phosphatidylinositol-3-phosphatase